MQDSPNAAIILIGDELLAGQTVDKNLPFLSQELFSLGIALSEVRIVGDSETDIVNAVRELYQKHTYVFTTGGIGPTHDDITASCIAKALNRPFVRNQDALKIALDYFDEKDLNEARLSMTDMPEGAIIIRNSATVIPAFYVENIYVLAGVPDIMKAMFLAIKPELKKGKIKHVVQLKTSLREGDVAATLGAAQSDFPEVEIGSYPHHYDGQDKYLKFVLRSLDQDKLHIVKDRLLANITPLEIIDE